MTALSVNINKVALIRNSREGENPNLIEYASACINAGADGITVHPRPDQRHVKPSDLPGLKELINKHTNIEFNIEGNPIDKFVKIDRSKYCSFISMGQLNYLSTLKFVDGVLGNSSSGLLEVPTFKKGTIYIGLRQTDRLKASSVIDAKPISKNITNAINKLYSTKFRRNLKKVNNPYGSGGASKKSFKILKKLKIKDIIKHKFFELKV